jgi:hypothetical protein
VTTEKIWELRLSPEQIRRQREKVRAALIEASANISGGKITRLSERDLALLFEHYDAVFLHGFFKANIKGKISFSLSRRMSQSAGKVISPGNLAHLPPEQERYELRLSADFFFNYGALEREKLVNGIPSRDALEALQLVFEHELCHLLELHLFKHSSCRGSRFKQMAANLFGHTQSYHHLPTVREIAGEKFGLSVGDPVRFTAEGHCYEGVISRITKRATVMVRDEKGDYRDQQGHRYSKWYVPLAMLEKVK